MSRTAIFLFLSLAAATAATAQPTHDHGMVMPADLSQQGQDGEGLDAAAAATTSAGHDHGMMSSAAMPDIPAGRIALSSRVEAPDGSAAVAGGEARIVVTLTDRETEAPVAGRQVFGWMELVRNAQVTAETSCRSKARILARGNVTATADVDLNSYKLLLLNADRAIAVVNPHVDFTITNMERVIPLPGEPFDWRMSGDGTTVFVSLPSLDLLIGIDTLTIAPIRLIGTGQGSRPAAVAALAGDRAAVELAGHGAVALVSAAADEPSPAIPVGASPLVLAADPTGGRLFAASADGHLVSIDTASRVVTAAITLDAAPAAMLWLPDLGRLALAPAGAADLRLLDAATLTVTGHVPLSAPATSLARVPSSGLVLALDRAGSRLSVIDPASGIVTATTGVADTPVEIGFSHDYAYVRGLGGDTFTALELNGIRKGSLAPIAIQNAASPRVQQGDPALERARLIAPAGHGALVANPAERVAYDYMEGMNVPMGTVPIYGTKVIGMLAIDRGFRETAPGIYEARATIRSSGVYEIVLALDSPDIVVCQQASVSEGSARDDAGRAPAITAALTQPTDGEAGAARRQDLAWRLVDSASGTPVTGVTDLRVLAYSPSGAWQKRALARETASGVYSATVQFPGDGRFGLTVSSVSRGLGPTAVAPAYVTIHPSPGDAPREEYSK